MASKSFVFALSCSLCFSIILAKSPSELKGVSNECFNKYWSSFVFYDSSTKLISGILNRNLFDFGSFDECYNYKEGDVYGKYCLGTLSKDGSMLFGLHLAHCLPSICTLEDFRQMSFLKLESFSEQFCYTKDSDPGLSAGAWVTIGILIFFACLVLLSTLYEYSEKSIENKKLNDLFLCFSAIKNTKQILAFNKNPNQLVCLNGIKALSMVWIFIYHEYQNSLVAGSNNVLEVTEFVVDKKNMWYEQGSIAVDTFFTVAGIVMVYSNLRQKEKGVRYNFLTAIVHRYFRLTPVLAITVLVYATLLVHLGNGPLWGVVDYLLVSRCRDYWWSAILYVQNYVNPGGECVNQSWYLSVDFQLFALSPIVLYFLRNSPKVAFIEMGVLIFAGILSPFLVTYFNELPFAGSFGDPNSDDYMSKLYVQTYTRFGVYIIGMACGYLIYNIKQKKIVFKLKKPMLIAAWFCTITVLVACTYSAAAFLNRDKDVVANSFFNALFRPAFSLAVCSTILLCITDNGGLIDKFLSLHIFQIIANLSYCMYIVHYAFITLRLAAARMPFRFSNAQLMFNFWGDFMYSLMISYLLSISFELPFLTIEKLFFGLFGW